MAIKVSRRELLKFTGGAIAGTLFTPLPWKLIDDLAIWTQTGPLVPKLARGPISTRAAACTLCPAGCAVKLALVAGRPFSVLPAARGAAPPAACPLGLAAHHLAAHPRRLRAPLARASADGRLRPASRDEAIAALATALSLRVAARKRDRVVFLDGRPGRAASAFYRALMARIDGGAYVPSLPPEERTLAALRKRISGAPEELGFDLDAASVIAGVGAPFLEGWGGPALAARLAARRCGHGSPLTLVQAEARASATALRSDRWLQVRPGTETAFALGLLNALARERLGIGLDGPGPEIGAIARLVRPEAAAAKTGVSEAAIREAAALLARGAGVAIGGGDAGGGPLPAEAETALAAIDVLLGALEPGGCVRPRRSLPLPRSLRGAELAAPEELQDLPDGSVGVLIVDAPSWGSALPEELLRLKLAPEGSLVVSFSPYLVGHATLADLVVPAPGWLEAIEEIPTRPAAPAASFALSPALAPAPTGATDPVAFLGEAAARAGLVLPGTADGAALIAERIEAIHAAGRGTVSGPAPAEPSAIASIPSSAALAKALDEGAIWEDEAGDWPDSPRARFVAPSRAEIDLLISRSARRGELPRGYPLLLVPYGRTGLSGEGPVPPLLAKLYRESDLRDPGATVHVHPRTAEACGVRDGAAVRVETRTGSAEARVVCDSALMPGVLFAAAGPDPEQLGEPGPRASVFAGLCVSGSSEGRWALPARLREA